MRHQHSGRQLGRNSSHRKVMFRNMATSLFRHERIRTTLPKAKELRRVAEPLITLSKNDAVARRRRAFDQLRDREIVTKLFDELGPRYSKRPGGYLRILKCGFRPGDNAPMAIVELVEGGDPNAGKPAKSGGGKSKRKAAAGKPATSPGPAAEQAQDTPAEDATPTDSEVKPQAQADNAPEADAGAVADDAQAGEAQQPEQASEDAAQPEADDSAGEADDKPEADSEEDKKS